MIKGGKECANRVSNKTGPTYPYEMGNRRKLGLVPEKGPGVERPFGNSLVPGGYEKGSRTRIQNIDIKRDPENYEEEEWNDNTELD